MIICYNATVTNSQQDRKDIGPAILVIITYELIGLLKYKNFMKQYSARKQGIEQGKKGFTLIKLLVVIAIIALLMGILMPALARVKKQAKSVACQALLKQWGVIWSMYCDDNNGNFSRGLVRGSGWHRGEWIICLSGCKSLKIIKKITQSGIIDRTKVRYSAS